MKLLSLNVGLPREVCWQNKTVATGIFKEPVEGSVMLRTLNLVGDKQADLSVHGGASKAVYAYPVEHYEFWKSELPDVNLPYGMFGENFTTSGLLEETVHIGDCFGVGEAEIMATVPRMPCYKLGIKFDRADMVKRFMVSRRTGIYFAVVKEGGVKAGDQIKRLRRDGHGITVAAITRLYAFEKDDLKMLRRVVQVEALPENWRDGFRRQIEKYAG